MVKRKWLWGKRSSDKNMAAETESCGSISSHSDKCSEDQEASTRSPCNSQSPEVNSRTNDMNREVINGSLQSLTLELSDVPGDDGSEEHFSNGNASKVSVDEDTRENSDTPIEDGSEKSSPTENVSTSSIDDTKGDKATLDARNCYQEDTESITLLTEKLSAALLNVRLKDDLVKQHSKVAEEAVAGWEMAEKEAAALKQQLEAAFQKKSALEARICHLDEALKECVRQLRLGRDEQERKINQVVAEKTNEFELAKTKLQDRLVELEALVETSRVTSPDPELQHKLEFLERENVALRRELQAQSEELEIRIIESDLSTKAAETASKQHLESIKKVSKLEAECRKLRSLSRMSSLSNDHKSTTALSYAESLTDSQSDGSEQLLSVSETENRKINGWGSHECNPRHSGSWASALIAELDQFKNEKVVDRSLHSCSPEINLMDDFLEMERLAGLPDSNPQVHSACCDQPSEKPVPETESKLRTELESLANRIAELEENISNVEVEKAELEENISNVEVEKSELERALAQTQSCLENSQVQLIETQIKLEQLERDLCGANEGEQFYKAVANSREFEASLMSSQIKALQTEIDRERALSEEISARCDDLEKELKKKVEELQIQQDSILSGELSMKDKALAETQDCLEKSQAQLKETEMKLKQLEKELEEANKDKRTLNSDLDCLRAEAQTMSNQIESLNQQVLKEQALVTKVSTKSKELENELQRKRQELDAQRRAQSNSEMKIKQEDLAVAAGKLADCQQTIASLGSQLKSLSTLEDFLIDTTSIPGFSPPAPLMARHSGGVPWKLHSNDTYLPAKGFEPLPHSHEGVSPFVSENGRDGMESQMSSSSSNSSAFFLHHPGSENSGNSFAKYFSLSRN